MRKDAYIIVICLIMYSANRLLGGYIRIDILHWLSVCYFGDYIGAIAFSAYCSIVVYIILKKNLNLLCVESIMFIGGLFWEFATPLYRKDSVTDLVDIVVYLLGGITYFFLANRIFDGQIKSNVKI